MIRVGIATCPDFVRLDRNRFRRTVRLVMKGEGIVDADISLAFVDNFTIHRLNNLYLGHDEPTDVLSFPLSEGRGETLMGELVIGTEVAMAQAGKRGHDVQAELTLYVIHGLLHLAGYDDKNHKVSAAMHARERHYLHLLDLPDIAPF